MTYTALLSELSSLMETLHLLRSPRNSERLLEAMGSAEHGEGERISVDKLRKEFDLGTDVKDIFKRTHGR